MTDTDEDFWDSYADDDSRLDPGTEYEESCIDETDDNEDNDEIYEPLAKEEVPCNCLGLSHDYDCPNWVLPV